MVRRIALGVLAAVAAAGLAAAIQPATAAPAKDSVPITLVEGTSPAVAPLGRPVQSRPLMRSHDDDMCPPPEARPAGAL